MVPFSLGGGPGGPGGLPMSLPLVTISNDLTLDNTHYYVLARDGDLTVTLPPSLPAVQGRVYVVKNVNAGNVTIAVTGTTGDRLDDGVAIAIARGRAATLIADGAGSWYEVGDGTGSRRARRPA